MAYAHAPVCGMTSGRSTAGETGRDAAPSRSRTRIGWVISGALAGLIVAGGALLFSVAPGSGISGFKKADGRVLFRALATRADSARAVSVAAADGGRVTLERADPTSPWRLAENGGYPVRSGAVERLLRSLTALRAAYVSAQASPSYAEYGLVEPASNPGTGTAVAVRDGRGAVLARALVGHGFAAPGLVGDRGQFIRLAGESRVWLADREISVSARPETWFDNTVVDIGSPRVRRVSLAGPDSPEIAIARGGEGELRIERGLPDGAELKGPWVLESIAGLLERVRFRDVMPSDRLPPEAAQIGIATVETTGGVAYTVRLLAAAADADPEDIRATFSAAPAGGADDAAAQRAEQFSARHAGWAYALPLHFIESMSIRPEDIARQSAAQ